MAQGKKIFTIGHSNRNIEDLANILRVYDIALLADVRSFPGSQKWPQFNKQFLSSYLQQVSISYIHMPLLGGKIPVSGGYTAYMQTQTFHKAIAELEQRSLECNTAYMCAEANWRDCHRSHISNFLEQKGWQVIHIKSAEISEQHFITPKQGKLF